MYRYVTLLECMKDICSFRRVADALVNNSFHVVNAIRRRNARGVLVLETKLLVDLAIVCEEVFASQVLRPHDDLVDERSLDV